MKITTLCFSLVNIPFSLMDLLHALLKVETIQEFCFSSPQASWNMYVDDMFDEMLKIDPYDPLEHF